MAVHLRGKEEFLIVDDLILCESGQPRFVQPVYANQNYARPYLWPCIVEKAWLKLKGAAMKKIIKVSPEEVFESFLPYPLQKVVFEGDSEQNIVGKIKKYLYELDRGNGCVLTSKESPSHRIGLSGKKNFYYIFSFNFEGKRLFYLRNPSGSVDFRGSYFDIPSEVLRVMRDNYKIDEIPEGNFILD